MIWTIERHYCKYAEHDCHVCFHFGRNTLKYSQNQLSLNLQVFYFLFMVAFSSQPHLHFTPFILSFSYFFPLVIQNSLFLILPLECKFLSILIATTTRVSQLGHHLMWLPSLSKMNSPTAVMRMEKIQMTYIDSSSEHNKVT